MNNIVRVLSNLCLGSYPIPHAKYLTCFMFSSASLVICLTTRWQGHCVHTLVLGNRVRRDRSSDVLWRLVLAEADCSSYTNRGGKTTILWIKPGSNTIQYHTIFCSAQGHVWIGVAAWLCSVPLVASTQTAKNDNSKMLLSCCYSLDAEITV